MAALGLTLADLQHDSVKIWPDNWQAFWVFESMSTQWQVGQAGATGLDYTALRVVLQLNEIPTSEWPDIFSAIRVMEGAALEVMHTKE